MTPLLMRFQKKASLNYKRRAFSAKGQAIVEYVLILSIFVLAMMAVTAGLNRGFGAAANKYLSMYKYNPSQIDSHNRFSF